MSEVKRQGSTRQSSSFVRFMYKTGMILFIVGFWFIYMISTTIPQWVEVLVFTVLLTTTCLLYFFGEIVIKPEEFLSKVTEDPFYYNALNGEGLLYRSKGQSSILKIFNRWAEPVQQELEDWIRKQKAREFLSEAKSWTGLDDRLDGVVEALSLDPSCLAKAQARVKLLLKADAEQRKQLLDAQAVTKAQLDADNWYLRQAEVFLSEGDQVPSIKKEAEAMLEKIERLLPIYQNTGTCFAWEEVS